MDEDVGRTGSPIVAVYVAQIVSEFLGEHVFQLNHRLERCLRRNRRVAIPVDISFLQFLRLRA